MVRLERSSRSPLSVLPGREKKKKKTPELITKTKILSLFMLFLSSIESRGTNKHSISFRGQVKNSSSVNIQFAAETAHFRSCLPWFDSHPVAVLHIPLFSELGQFCAACLTAAIKRASLWPNGESFTYGIYVKILYLPSALLNLSFPCRYCHQLWFNMTGSHLFCWQARTCSKSHFYLSPFCSAGSHRLKVWHLSALCHMKRVITGLD